MLKKVKYLIDYFKYLENPFEALRFKFGILNSCNLKIKKGGSIQISDVSTLNDIMGILPNISSEKISDFLKYMVDIANDEEFVIINGIKYINVYNSNFINQEKHKYSVHLEEFFTDDDWDMVNFSKRHVIDIGGNVGDTALYFAVNGAEVISFEPVTRLYELAVKNIALNSQYEEKILLVNKGVGGKRGILTFQDDSVSGYTDENSSEMEIISLEDLLNDFEFTPDILKMDCEGCEFEIIENNDLTMFNDIIFEHHSMMVKKDANLLINKLKEQGFKINTYKCNASGLDFEDIGIIHAFR